MIDPAASFVEAARYLPALLFGLKGDLAGGLALNILLALLALPASLLLGVILGCFRVFSLRFLAPFAIAYTELVKSVPLVLMLFWMHYALPLFLGVRSLPPGLTAVAALTVYGTAQERESPMSSPSHEKLPAEALLQSYTCSGSSEAILVKLCRSSSKLLMPKIREQHRLHSPPTAFQLL